MQPCMAGSRDTQQPLGRKNGPSGGPAAASPKRDHSPRNGAIPRVIPGPISLASVLAQQLEAEQFGWSDSEPLGNQANVVQTHVALSSLHAPEIAAIQLDCMRERLLRDAFCRPKLANTPAKQHFWVIGCHPLTVTPCWLFIHGL